MIILILKQEHCKGWFKVKPLKTVDAFVTGYTYSESDTKFGWLRAVQVSVWSVDKSQTRIASVGTGFTDEFRREMCGDKAESLINRVCEIEYDSIAANGKLKFPRFLRWRYDKSMEDCAVDQL